MCLYSLFLITFLLNFFYKYNIYNTFSTFDNNCNFNILHLQKNFKEHQFFCLLLLVCFFIILFHEKTFFNGVAGQGVLNHVYQPSSFGVLFFLSFALFIHGKYYLSILSLVASVYFHPTYLLHSGFSLLVIFCF